MTLSADCINTRSEQGRNATPLPIIEAVHEIFGGTRSLYNPGIELDLSSDRVINQDVLARRFYGINHDSFSQEWEAKTAWLNPPGTTVRGGSYYERLYWLGEMKKPKKEQGPKPIDVSVVKASEWYFWLFHYWQLGHIENAIALVYRGGSLGSVGCDFLNSADICLTAKGAKSPIVSGSGRLSFELITDEETRSPQTSNTQSSVILGLFRNHEMRQRFRRKMTDFGVVK